MLGWGVFAGALAYCVLVLTGNATYYANEPAIFMGDAGAYYFTETPYDWTDDPVDSGEYRYAPAFLWLVRPLGILPWELFAGLWFTLHVAVLVYLRVPWLLAFPPVLDDVLWGNIYTFLALAVVLILRHRAAALWAVVLLTKVTPGVGMAWHAARREWRALAIAGTVTAGIVLTGVVLETDLWFSWLDALAAAPGSYAGLGGGELSHLIPRMILGGVVAAYAGWTQRAWLLPIGMLIAVPGFFPYSFALLIASVVLYRDSRQPQPGPAPVRSSLAGEGG